MFYIVTMLMVKRMKTSNDVVTGCLKSELHLFHLVFAHKDVAFVFCI